MECSRLFNFKNVSLDTLTEPCLGKPGGYENLIDVIRYFGKTNENVIHNEKKLQELEKLLNHNITHTETT